MGPVECTTGKVPIAQVVPFLLNARKSVIGHKNKGIEAKVGKGDRGVGQSRSEVWGPRGCGDREEGGLIGFLLQLQHV